MARSVEEDLYQLETGLRNLNVELEPSKLLSNGVQNSVSQESSLLRNSDNLNPEMLVPNTSRETLLNEAKPNTNPSQNVVESGKEPTKTAQSSRYPEEGSSQVSCSQQARNEDCGSVDELAGYFDNLLYIPRKMSPMAEMMYM